MVVAAYDVKTGKIKTVFAGPSEGKIHPELISRANAIGGIGSKGISERNTVGICAEFKGINELLLDGSKIENIRLTKALRPRTGEARPYCDNLISKGE